MVNPQYINPFVQVHSKVKAFKDHLREANKVAAELREIRSVQETKEIITRDRNPGRTGVANALRDSV